MESRVRVRFTVRARVRVKVRVRARIRARNVGLRAWFKLELDLDASQGDCSNGINTEVHEWRIPLDSYIPPKCLFDTLQDQLFYAFRSLNPEQSLQGRVRFSFCLNLGSV